MNKLNVYQKLLKVQSVLKVPKNQFNKFMNFKYRSCEDILEYAKPVCVEHGLLLTTDNKVVSEGDSLNARVFVRSKARVTCIDSEKHMEVSACAEIPISKKGMDSSQITGSAQSYSRKYALSGLFSLDDLKDSDSNELTQQSKTKDAKTSTVKPKQKYTQEVHDKVIPIVSENGFTDEVKERLSKYDISEEFMKQIVYASEYSELPSAHKTLLQDVK